MADDDEDLNTQILRKWKGSSARPQDEEADLPARPRDPNARRPDVPEDYEGAMDPTGPKASDEEVLRELLGQNGPSRLPMGPQSVAPPGVTDPLMQALMRHASRNAVSPSRNADGEPT
jgi:hypothetical protein